MIITTAHAVVTVSRQISIKAAYTSLSTLVLAVKIAALYF
jgi:hypothetical protein